MAEASNAAALSRAECSILIRDLQHAKPFVSRLRADDARHTVFEKTRVNAPSVRRGSFHTIDLHQPGRVALKPSSRIPSGGSLLTLGRSVSVLIRNKRLKVVKNNKFNLDSLGCQVQTELLPERGKDRIREAVGRW